jgi:hypothetical protein
MVSHATPPKKVEKQKQAGICILFLINNKNNDDDIIKIIIGHPPFFGTYGRSSFDFMWCSPFLSPAVSTIPHGGARSYGSARFLATACGKMSRSDRKGAFSG